MAQRTNKADIIAALARFNEITGAGLQLDCANGGYKINDANNDEITDRGTASETLAAFWAYRRGFFNGRDSVKAEIAAASSHGLLAMVAEAKAYA